MKMIRTIYHWTIFWVLVVLTASCQLSLSFACSILAFSKPLQKSGNFVQHALHVATIRFRTQAKQPCAWFSGFSQNHWFINKLMLTLEKPVWRVYWFKKFGLRVTSKTSGSRPSFSPSRSNTASFLGVLSVDKEYRAMDHGTLSVDAMDAGKGERVKWENERFSLRLSHDT